jgi:hypothetical protein
VASIYNISEAQVPVLEHKGYNYYDPAALRALLDTKYGPNGWETSVSWYENGVYSIHLDICGVTRTAIVDFNQLPDLNQTASIKFDYLLSEAAKQFGLGAASGFQAAFPEVEKEITEQATVAEKQIEAVLQAVNELPAEEEVVYSQEQIDEALVSCLTTIKGSNEQWDKLKARGMTDEELKDAIAVAFGIEGGKSHPIPCSYKGGRTPKFWTGIIRDGKPVYQGKALISKVRELLGIPEFQEQDLPTPIDANSVLAMSKETEPAPTEPAETTDEESEVAEESAAQEDTLDWDEEGDGTSAPIGQETPEELPVEDETPTQQDGEISAAIMSALEEASDTTDTPAGAEQDDPFVDQPIGMFEDAAEQTAGIVPPGYSADTAVPAIDPDIAKVESLLGGSAVETAAPPTTEAWPKCPVCGKAVPLTLVKKCTEELHCEPMHAPCYMQWKNQQGG